MDSLQNYQILLSVVDCGGFSAAAKELGLTTAKVSRAVAELESETRVKLLQRTTRRVAVTEAGNVFLNQLRPALAQLENARIALTQGITSCSFNSLRLSCCRAGGLGLIAAGIPSFMAAQPRLKLTLDLHDRPVNPDNEGYDLALAIGQENELPVGNSQNVFSVDVAVVASPSYVATHKRPQSSSELLQHDLLIWSGMPRWRMRDNTEIAPPPPHYSNDLNIIKECCIAACGIALLPVFMVTTELRERVLVQVLDGFEPRPLLLSANWGQRSAPNAAADAFLKHLRRHLRSKSS